MSPPPEETTNVGLVCIPIARQRPRVAQETSTAVPDYHLARSHRSSGSIERSTIRNATLNTCNPHWSLCHTANDGQSMIPGLWKIPLLGALFRNKTTQENTDELMIFITPRVMKTL